MKRPIPTTRGFAAGCKKTLKGTLAGLLALVAASVSYGDIPGRPSPAGTSVPLPGTQQQELANITFPAPYNVFEFPGTCMACHGGSIDQQAGHGSNWAGSNMASAARDPIFRAHQILVNNSIKNATGEDGAGNMCWRCHSPNGWLSGRFDPELGGAADGSDMIQSILLSTDGEGVQCEQCHRAVGGVTMGRSDLDLLDPAWNMLAGIFDWPHAGEPFPQGPGADEPYANGALQYHDAMSYGAKYGGTTELSFSDLPLGGDYTGQIYGTVPWWFTGTIPPAPPGMPDVNPLGDLIFYNLDGGLSVAFEGGVMPDPMWGAVSPEHSTRVDDFVKSPEMCGSCHDLTIPVQNHGMPIQRTYTEWKHSAFGRDDPVPGVTDTRCQGCHMPTMKHEYTDDMPVSLNPDPLLSGWYPYSKDRNIGGGTSFHKFAGGDRDLPQMMKVLYPEVDLELIGQPTGHDPMIFPGMLSDRGPMWDRASRNTEIALRDAVSAEIASGPTCDGAGQCQLTVRVTNLSGHKIPSGFPAGQRMWLGLVVKDSTGAVVYQSGHYDPASARLYNDASMTGLDRALSPTIDEASNAVMVYEKATGTCAGAPMRCTESPDLLNDTILFDNRIPPLGYDYAAAGPLGGAFWSYEPATLVPFEDPSRYPADASGYSRNWDEINYSFDAAGATGLTARAEVHYQSHAREYMDYLVSATNALPATDRGPRPEGPPNPMDPLYPLTPTYLSDSIAVTTGEDFTTLTDLDGNVLEDNWAGVAYAAWMLTGQGAPFTLAADDTAVESPPAAPANVTVSSPADPGTGLTDPNAQSIRWNPVASADGYRVWIRYGASDLTSDWDKLAIVPAPQTELLNVALNPGKTFAYRVEAFNAKGYGPASAAATGQTPANLPMPPINTRVRGTTETTVRLSWFDQADNEIGFIVERQDVPVDRNQPLPNFREVARFSSLNPAAMGGVTFTDGTARPTCSNPPQQDPGTGGCYTTAWIPLEPGRTYNYQIQAYNASGLSGPDLPVTATTLGRPLAPTGLTAVAPRGTQVDLSWSDNSGNETGFRIERSVDGTTFITVGNVGANITAYSDLTVAPDTAYWYRVYAFNAIGLSLQPTNVATVRTPADSPAPPSGLVATPSALSPNPPTVSLTWTDNSTNETGFLIDRALDVDFTLGLTTASVGANVTSYLDTTVAPKTTYYYRVVARNLAGLSVPSNTASAVTPGEIPEAPANLRVVATYNTRIVLRWADRSNNETGFYIERQNATGWVRVGTVAADVRRYVDTSLARRTTYTYRVQAFNADGVSAYTAPVSGTTR